jgi:CBS domain-containing protein
MILLCSEVMRRDVGCVGPNTSVVEIARKMRDEVLGFLPICDEQQRVLGIVTDRDIALRIVADGREADQTSIGEIMRREPIFCRPGDAAARAANLMQRHRQTRILVTDQEGSLCGVISLSDLAEHMDPLTSAAVYRAVSSLELSMGRPVPSET